MKTISTKAKMLPCAMAVAIGFVGGAVGEASAASKYGGVSTMSIIVPSYNYTMGKVTISSSCGGSTSASVEGFAWTKTAKISGYSNKKNDSVKLTVTYSDSNGKKVDTDSIKVKVTDLGKKNFNITFKKSGNKLTKVYINKK